MDIMAEMSACVGEIKFIEYLLARVAERSVTDIVPESDCFN